jgi:hypothetical protein
MKSAIRSLALASLFLVSAGGASAAVTVTFVQPDQYADLPFSSWDREQVLTDLREHFTKLSKTLPAGTDLKIEVLDVDLAGRIYPNFRGSYDLRILRGGADWPHMRLRYTVEQDGKLVSSGEDKLSNMMYLDRMNRYFTGDPLRYEKQMIDEWFKEKIAVR